MDTVKTGRFIAQLRHEKGLTQQQLAEALGVTDKTVSRWENANYMPDIGMLQSLAATLEVSESELLNGERGSTASTEKAKDTLAAVCLFVFRVIVLPLSFALPTVAAWYIYITAAIYVSPDLSDPVWEIFRIAMILGSTAWLLLVNRLHKRSLDKKPMLITALCALLVSALCVLIIEKILFIGWGTFEQLIIVLLAYLVSRILAMRSNNK